MSLSSSGPLTEGAKQAVHNELDFKPLTFRRIKSNSSKEAFSLKTDAQPELPEISINGYSIEPEELMAEAQYHPAETADIAIKEAALALTIKSLLLQEAARLNMDATPQVDNDGRMETLEDALIHALLDKEVTPPLAQDSDCRRYYNQHPDKFCSDTIYEVKHILLAAHIDQSENRDAQKALAESLVSHLLQTPEDFATLAATHSDCPSREQGGNLGQLTRGSTVPEFERALESIQVGEVAKEPVESRFGFHVVQLERCIPGEVLPFENAQERIAAWLEASSWSRAVAQYVSILAGKADIKGFSVNTAESPLVQ